jgi:hypothetical protein
MANEKFDERKLFLTDEEYNELRANNDTIKVTEEVIALGDSIGINHGKNLAGILQENAIMLADEMMVLLVEGEEIPESVRDLVENYLYVNNRIFRDARKTFGDKMVEGTINKIFGEDAQQLNDHLAGLAEAREETLK